MNYQNYENQSFFVIVEPPSIFHVVITKKTRVFGKQKKEA